MAADRVAVRQRKVQKPGERYEAQEDGNGTASKEYFERLIHGVATHDGGAGFGHVLEYVLEQPRFAGFGVGRNRYVGDGDTSPAGSYDSFHGVAEIGDDIEAHSRVPRIGTEAAGRVW